MLHDLFSLFYPRTCHACNHTLLRNETQLCTRCHYYLPYTHYHLDKLNPVVKLFWGRVQVSAAASFLHFRKGGATQHLLHALKYQGEQDLGVHLGKLYARQLAESSHFASADLVVPVPLHAHKKRQRGYNQSMLFASGLAEGLKKESREALVRTQATETQTRKSRFARYLNTKEVFAVANPAEVEQKHVLLVDDVVTTGATLEACASLLLQQEGCRVSIATIAATL